MVDIRQIMEKPNYVTSKTRKIYAQTIRHKQIKKIAILGNELHTFYKVVVNFIMLATQANNKFKWFEDESSAYSWFENINKNKQ